MSSWLVRAHGFVVRWVVRRRSWGDERSLTRRARFIFGAPILYRSLVSRGVRRVPCASGSVRGEWLIPRASRPGIVLFVHGGGFVSCSAATHRPIAAALARLSGHNVFSLDYRLAPEHRFPAALEDVLAAYAWLTAEAAPRQRIVLAGDSAGGNLVIAAAMRLRDLHQTPPAGLVVFSPWTDLAGTGASARGNDGRDVMFHLENLAEFASAYLGRPAHEVPDASPAMGELSGLPPILLHVGADEILLDDAVRIHDAVQRGGGISRLTIYEDVAHGWQMLAPFVPEATASLREAAAFAVGQLGPSVGSDTPRSTPGA
jgi:acetyl esterase/lipase